MRGVVQALALIAILLAIVSVRVVWSSRTEWRAAVAATGDDEILHLGRAARLYAPGNPYSRRAVDRLAAIGRGDPARALAAWRELRSALLATRSFYTPHRALLAEANARLAELMADAEIAAGTQKDARAGARLARRAPGPGRSAVGGVDAGGAAGAGGLDWLRAGPAACARVGDDDRLRPRAALAWALGVGAGLALFFLGLARA